MTENQTNLIIISSNNEALTTTLAIAEGTDVEHASVIKLVRTYLSDLEDFGQVDFKSEMVVRPQGGGAEREYALLNEDQATLLMTYMRNSEVVRNFKKRLVKEFRNMHNQLRTQLPQTYAEALRALADKAETAERLALENRQQQVYIEEAQPKVELHDKLMESDSLYTIPQAAKLLKMKIKDFKLFLVHLQFTYKDDDKFTPYHPMLMKNYMELKFPKNRVYIDEEGREHVNPPTVAFTARGIALFTKRMKKCIADRNDIMMASYPEYVELFS